MKRLLALIGFTCFSVLTAAFYLGVNTAAVLALVSLSLYILSLCIRKIRRIKTYSICFLTAFLSCVLFLGYTFVFVGPVVKNFDNVSDTVEATQLKEVYYSGGYYRYELKVSRIGDQKVNTKMSLSCKQPLYTEPFDRITIKDCELHKVQNTSMISKGIYLSAYFYEETDFESHTPENKPLMYHIMKLNNTLRRALYSELSLESANFSSALLLGDKYAIDKETSELLRVNGLSHIAVVSGLHLSIVSSLVFLWLGKIIRNRYITGALTIVSIIFFAALTGFGFSVIRAAVLQIIYVVGRMLSRQHDSLNSLGLAALLVILINPYCVGDLGIQLSFLATLGIVLLSQRTYDLISLKAEKPCSKFKRLLVFIINAVLSVMIPSACATLFTLPVAILNFGGFSGVILISNALLVPVLSFVLIFILLCSLFHYVTFLPFIADTFAFLVELYYKILILVCKTLEKLPFSYIRTTEVYFYIWLAFTLILVSLAILIRTRKGYIVAALLSLIILLCGAAAYKTARKNVVTLNVPYTGDGVCVIASNNDSHAVLSMGGSRYRTYLLENCVESKNPDKNDVLINVGGKDSEFFLGSMMSMFDYGQVLMYDNISEDASDGFSDYKGEVTTFSGDFTVDLWEKAVVTLRNCKDTYYEYVVIGETEILILTDKLDVHKISKEHRAPDMLITREIPESFTLLRCETLIIPGDDYKAYAGAEAMSSITDRIITGEDITIDIDS